MPGPLTGYRIVDLTSNVAGPLATMILADQGADVIKIEAPDGGDATRAGGSRRAGFTAVEASGSAWCYTGAGDRAWWGRSWAQRLTESPFGDRAVEHGLATREDLARLARGWLRWADSEDAWFLIPHGEVLCEA